MTQDIRWQQRLANYEKALAQLTSVVELSRERELSDLEKQGLIRLSTLPTNWPGTA